MEKLELVGFSKDFDLTTFRDKVNALIDAAYPPPQNSWNYIKKLSPAYVVFQQGEDLWQVNLIIGNGNEVALADGKTKVTLVPQAAESIKVKVSESSLLTLDKGSKKGYKWNITVVAEGLTRSANLNLASYGYPNKFAKKNYTAEAIQDAGESKIFDGTPVILRSPEQHLATANGGGSKLLPNEEAKSIAALIQNSYAAEGAVKAQLDIRKTKAGEALRAFLLERAEVNPERPFDLSWTGEMDCVLRNAESHEPILDVTKILEAISVDPVPIGNAGGRVERAAESFHTPTMNAKELKKLRAKVITLASEADVEGADEAQAGSALPTTVLDWVAKYIYDNVPGAKTLTTLEELSAKSEEELVKMINEHLKGKPEPMPDAAAEAKKAEEDKKKAAESVLNAEAEELKNQFNILRVSNARNYLNATLAQNSDLPPATQDKIRTEVTGRLDKNVLVAESEIDTMVRTEREYLAKMNINTPSYATSLRVTLDEKDKIRHGWENFFSAKGTAEGNKVYEELYGINPSERKYRVFPNSFKQAWCTTFGLKDIGSHSMYRDSDGRPAKYTAESFLGAEAFDADSGEIAGDIIATSIHRRLVAEYKALIQFDEWKKIATVENLTDFKAYTPEMMGYFSDLDTITEGNAFQEKELSGSDQVSMTLGRKGNKFSITFEQLRNDDLNRIQKIPVRLAFAAHRQLSEFVWDKLLYGFDNTFSTKAGAPDFFSSGNNNIPSGGVDALDAAAVEVGWLAMMQQQELGSTKVMGLQPKYLIVPPALNSAAYPITTLAAGLNNSVPTVSQAYNLERIVVPHWTNPLKWILAAPKEVIEGLTVGFLDGREEPEIINEMPNTGDHFNKLSLVYRAHHVYAATGVDPRAFYGSKQS